MIIGSHVKMSAPLYVEGSVKEALSYGANALMIYTGAPQNTTRVPIEKLHISEARELLRINDIPVENIIVHAPYLINPANSVKKEVQELAFTFLKSELQRTAEIGAKYLVLHPGSFTTTDLETGINSIVNCLNQLGDYPEDVIICLETMAGKGSEVGRTFEELHEILSRVDYPQHYGVCLDTCHINDAGYDVSDFDGILDTFDEVIGLDRLYVIHLNDSKNVRGSHKDRHANIGEGTIGFDALYEVASNPRVENIVKILETPYVEKKPPYQYEIEMLRSGSYDPNKLNVLKQNTQEK